MEAPEASDEMEPEPETAAAPEPEPEPAAGGISIEQQVSFLRECPTIANLPETSILLAAQRMKIHKGLPLHPLAPAHRCSAKRAQRGLELDGGAAAGRQPKT